MRSGRRNDGVPWDTGDQEKEGGQKETAMTIYTVMRFLRARRTYWTVVHELSNYSDRELYDIGIDRADIHEIARLASREQQ